MVQRPLLGSKYDKLGWEWCPLVNRMWRGIVEGLHRQGLSHVPAPAIGPPSPGVSHRDAPVAPATCMCFPGDLHMFSFPLPAGPRACTCLPQWAMALWVGIWVLSWQLMDLSIEKRNYKEKRSVFRCVVRKCPYISLFGDLKWCVFWRAHSFKDLRRRPTLKVMSPCV